MKPLASSERTLFLVLCGTIFIALNLLALRSFLQANAKMQQAIMAAKTELAADQGWLNLAETLHPAINWVNAHPMPQMQSDDASSHLLKLEQGEAEKAGLKVMEENLLPAQDIPKGSSVGVSVKLSGPFNNIVQFLFSLQNPTAWRSIDKLTVRSDAQPPNVIADLELRQYFHPGATSDFSSQTVLPSASPTP